MPPSKLIRQGSKEGKDFSPLESIPADGKTIESQKINIPTTFRKLEIQDCQKKQRNCQAADKPQKAPTQIARLS
jgi:hypothetical protein